MAQPGALFGSVIGPQLALRQIVSNGGVSAYTMSAQNYAWAARL